MPVLLMYCSNLINGGLFSVSCIIACILSTTTVCTFNSIYVLLTYFKTNTASKNYKFIENVNSVTSNRRRAARQNEISSNDFVTPHRPDALCLFYTELGVDNQWWSSSNSCSSPSAASWPGTEYVGSTSAQRLPDSAFIGPQTLPRSCANRPPIPTPVFQVEMYPGKVKIKIKSIFV